MPETLADVDLEITDAVADRIVAKLSGSVISSSIPAGIGEEIREAAKGRAIYWTSFIPLAGPRCITQMWVLNPDGTIQLELRNSDNVTFWRGTFRPAEAVPDGRS